MVLNTSFNENEPVVCKPQEAFDCFLRTKMDLLVIGNTVISRQDASDEPIGFNPSTTTRLLSRMRFAYDCGNIGRVGKSYPGRATSHAGALCLVRLNAGEIS